MIKALQLFTLSFLLLIPFSSVGQHPETWMYIEDETPVVYPASVYHQEGLSYLKDTTIYPNDFERYMDIVRQSVQHTRFETAIYWCNKALKTSSITPEQTVKIYNLLTGLNIRLGHYQQALNMYFNVVSNTEDSAVITGAKTNISNIYAYIGNFEQADLLIQDAQTFYSSQQDTMMYALALLVDANNSKFKTDYKKSIALNLHAESILSTWLGNNSQDHPTRVKNVNNHTLSLNNTADIYILRKMPDSALYYLNELPENILDIPQDLRSAIYISYGEAWAQKENADLALSYYKKGLDIAEPLGISFVQSTAYKAMSELLAAQGAYRDAWIAQEKYVALNAKTFSRDNIQKMNQLEVQYAVAKKDGELAKQALLLNEKKLQLNKRDTQYYLLLVSLGFSAVIIAFIFRNAFNRQRFLKAEVKNAAQQRHIAQIEATLKGEENERERIAQELHDSVVSEILALRINLKNVSHKHLELQDSEDYRNVLYQSQELTEKLRSATHNMMPARLKELGLVKTIAAFVKRINSHKLRIDFQSYGRIVQLKDSTEKMLLMITHELVQNILKHAKATNAIIQLNYFDESLSLTVEDNGVGFSADEQAKDGIGWQGIQKNIQMLNAQMDIQSSEFKGTTILIELVLTEHLPDTAAVSLSTSETI